MLKIKNQLVVVLLLFLVTLEVPASSQINKLFATSTKLLFRNDIRCDAQGNCVNYTDYMHLVERTVKSNWVLGFVDYSSRSYEVVVFFKIKNDGTVYDIKVLKSSKSRFKDRAAIKAIKRSSPFPPLPEGALEFVKIEFTFTYNVLT